MFAGEIVLEDETKTPKSRQIPTCFKVHKSLLVKTLANASRVASCDGAFVLVSTLLHTRTANFLVAQVRPASLPACPSSPLIGAGPVDDVAAAPLVLVDYCVFYVFASTRKEREITNDSAE